MKWSEVSAKREVQINQILSRPDFKLAYTVLTGKVAGRRAAAKFLQGRGIVREQGRPGREVA